MARAMRERQVDVLRPATYGDAEKVAQGLKAGNAVVVDLTKTRPELAKRILDFSFGATSALDGKVDRIADRIYAFTVGGKLNQGEQEYLKKQGVV
jgi:cell division inhibitor SepF